MREKFLLTFFLLLFPLAAYGQQVPDSSNNFLNGPANHAAYNYDKQGNTSSFLSDVSYKVNTSLLEALFFDSYQSTAIHSSDQNLRETHKLKFALGYPVDPTLSVGVLTDYLNLNDSRVTGVNSTNRSAASLFARYAIDDSIFLSAMSGVTKNTQIGVTDKGMIYDFEGNLRSYSLFDMVVSGSLMLHDERISPRYDKQHSLALGLETPNGSPIRNILKVNFDDQRNDFYLLADSLTAQEFKTQRNIQQRLETNYGIEDRLENIPIIPDLTSMVALSYFMKQVDREYYLTPMEQFSKDVVPEKINETRIEASGELNYVTSGLASHFKMLFQERDENRTIPSQSQLPQLPDDLVHNAIYLDLLTGEERMNNTSKRISLSWMTDWHLTGTQMVSVSLSHTKLRYDTPSDLNDDDRDELLSIARISYRNQLFPFFAVSGMLEGSMSHLVYIAASRSSNNDKNKILRLQTAGEFTAGDFRNLAAFDILANYTIYDYEDLNTSIRSFSFRQFQASDSMRLSLAKNLFLRGSFYAKISEQGSLNWGEFSVTPLHENHENFAHVQLATNWMNFLYAAGVRYFTLRTYAFNVRQKSIDYSYKSIGPSVEISAQMKGSVRFRLTGWYDFITLLDAPSMRQSTIQLQCLINF